MPKTKISLGLSAYGYDWDVTHHKGDTLAWNATPALISRTHATPKWDSATSSPYFNYKATDGSSHVVWYENDHSVGLKAGLAKTKDFASVSVWALGLDNPSYWDAITTGFSAKTQKLHKR